ncbi:unnamed protein product [Eruca vesicaria subsp. sativa]|uniref:Uncharacterized protein n=1 Tax=Eruca vesicaria subsp. sativa TaxID=29727 RepID=A0ABC8KTN2_ERUVS|nr:unnamed protein product [Eruca vesicaria subsp. sativa]
MEDSSCATKNQIRSSGFSTSQERKRRRLSEEVVGNSTDLSLLQSLKTVEESSEKSKLRK